MGMSDGGAGDGPSFQGTIPCDYNCGQGGRVCGCEVLGLVCCDKSFACYDPAKEPAFCG
jgi:hypothetical protein